MFYKLLPIVKKEVINNKYFIITFSNLEMAKQCHPGQFFKLKDLHQELPILPRPFSVYKVKNDKISFLIKVVGLATRYFFEKALGEDVALLGPLGNGFQIVRNKKVMIVSGGIGYAPLIFLDIELKKEKNKVFFFHGGKSSEDIFSENVRNFTEDGSTGEKGLATDGVENFLNINQIDAVYACGPKIMLKKLSEICKKYNTEFQVSMETIMGCGLGSCCGCSIKMIENGKIVYKKVCKDGPVFDGCKVVWDD